jgi:hypothetical protein
MEAAAASNNQYAPQQSNGYSFADQTEQLRRMYENPATPPTTPAVAPNTNSLSRITDSPAAPVAAPVAAPPALARPIVDYSSPPTTSSAPQQSTPLVANPPGSPLASAPPRSVPLVVEPPAAKSTPFRADGFVPGDAANGVTNALMRRYQRKFWL